MACEFLNNSTQDVSLNSPVLFNSSIPCRKGNVYHDSGSGVFILKGITSNQCFATYQVTYNGNIAVPEAGELTPIAIAITVSGEPRVTSRAIFTPQAVDEYGNVTSTAIIKVPKGCCFTVSVEYVSGVTADPTVIPTPVINVLNSNLVIDRIA
jgi:hypothetical protein